MELSKLQARRANEKQNVGHLDVSVTASLPYPMQCTLSTTFPFFTAASLIGFVTTTGDARTASKICTTQSWATRIEALPSFVCAVAFFLRTPSFRRTSTSSTTSKSAICINRLYALVLRR
jgi:hypothetical protein